MFNTLSNAIRSLFRRKKEKESEGYSIEEIAEVLGLFPSDVEEELKELQKIGAVHCYMYDGKLYAVFKKDVKIKDKEFPSDPMFR